MIDNTIVEKIQKLLSLGSSPNENEAKTAMLKAQELLLKHKLSMQEIQGYQPKGKVKIFTSDFRFRSSEWKPALMVVICENFGCIGLTIRELNTYRLAIVGKDENLEICFVILKYAISYVESRIRELKIEYYKNNRSANGLANNYGAGFAVGLAMQYKEQVRSDTSYALVVQKDPEVEEFLDDLNIKQTRESTLEPDRNHRDAIIQGIKDGRNFKMSDKVEARTATEMIA